RPTSTAASLAACLAFYGPTGLGLPLIGQFSDDAFDGVILGMPDHGHQLEFTFDKRHAGMDCRAPTKDNLLVFYFENKEAIQPIVARLLGTGLGKIIDEPENEWWKQNEGVTVEGPEGWRITLFYDEQ
ncbi:glyoxalase/bleomycin resistance protein/dioxygenase, partial [Obelidium mucronatum]